MKGVRCRMWGQGCRVWAWPNGEPSLMNQISQNATDFVKAQLLTAAKHRGISLIRTHAPLGPCRGTTPIRKRPTPKNPPRTLGIGLE
jgi:hypothetical protein